MVTEERGTREEVGKAEPERLLVRQARRDFQVVEVLDMRLFRVEEVMSSAVRPWCGGG